MAEEIDVTEVVQSIERLRANYRRPLVGHKAEEKPRNAAASVLEKRLREDQARS